MTVLRPGQVEPNEFELAVLERLAAKEPSIRPFTKGLHVLSRTFTGVGCFTSFLVDSRDDSWDRHVTLDELILMPGVRYGMSAVHFRKDGQPKTLEVFAYDERWDGVYDGFSFETVVKGRTYHEPPERLI